MLITAWLSCVQDKLLNQQLEESRHKVKIIVREPTWIKIQIINRSSGIWLCVGGHVGEHLGGEEQPHSPRGRLMYSCTYWTAFLNVYMLTLPDEPWRAASCCRGGGAHGADDATGVGIRGLLPGGGGGGVVHVSAAVAAAAPRRAGSQPAAMVINAVRMKHAPCKLLGDQSVSWLVLRIVLLFCRLRRREAWQNGPEVNN